VSDATLANSAANVANYTLSRDGAAMTIRELRYDRETRTATLRFDVPDPGDILLTVKGGVASRDGLTLGTPYTSEFVAVSDFSAQVRVDFTATRSDRLHGTVSYDVLVTNTTDYDLLAPLRLVLDPARYFAGSPQAATLSSNGLWLIDLALAGTKLAPGESTVVKPSRSTIRPVSAPTSATASTRCRTRTSRRLSTVRR